MKLLIGGSPCTHWSIAQKNNRETTAEGIGWELFRNYLIAKEKFKPDFFLYENNKSAAQPIKDQIAKEFGVTERSIFSHDNGVRMTYINSALVSAQNRQRFYVTNFGDIEQPEDRGILLKDILETGEARFNKSYCIDASYYKGGNYSNINNQAGRRLAVAEPVCVAQRGRYRDTGTRGKKTDAEIDQYYEAREDGKTNALTTVSKDNAVAEPVCMCYKRSDEAKKLRKQYETGEVEHGFNEHRELHPRTDGKTNTLSTVLKDNPICEPVRVGCYPSPDGTLKNSQGMRLYSIEGKSDNLTANGGGMGAKTGLYAIPVEFEDGIPVKAISCADGKEYPVYQVLNGQITIKGKQYPIKLADGYYIIRKLTVKECCRLQTMPDDYMRAVSATQGYKGLGNGWTAEVIIHLLNHTLKNVPRNEPITVLSMYDGIGTGRYCLDKMGFTNVEYHAYEIDKYPMAIANDNYPDIIQHGDAFAVREDDWKIL